MLAFYINQFNISCRACVDHSSGFGQLKNKLVLDQQSFNMYNLSYFKEPDSEKVIGFMHAHSFVTLCGCSANGSPVATQVPLLISNNGDNLRFRGHFMRKTDHHLAFEENPNVLVLFTGAHEYVSASWYSDPAQASTWNYMSVHARGTLHFTDEQELIEVLRDTTSRYENNPHSPASFDNLSHDYVNKLIKAIIGFTIEVKEIDNVFKLSQNRDHSSFNNIITKLTEKGGDGAIIAREMKEREEELYRK